MKLFFITMYEKAFSFFCIVSITYCIFYPYILGSGPFHLFIRLILFLFSIMMGVGMVMSYLFPYLKPKKKELKMTGIIRKLYLNSYQIIFQSLCYYLAVYLFFYLDQISIFYNYLILFLLGLYLGYRIAITTNKYSDKDKK